MNLAAPSPSSIDSPLADLPPGILRAYDIRGTVGQDITTDIARSIGFSFAQSIKQEHPNARSICVGYDGRVSSPELEAAIVDGITRAGLDAVCIGLGPTPMLYHAVIVEKADGGVMITGSHNPPDQNGFKFMRAKKPFFGEDITNLPRYLNQPMKQEQTQQPGTSRQVSILERYVSHLASHYRAGSKALRVAWDAGNGAAGEVMAKLTAQLPGEHILLNEVIDGTFPVHHPDPSVAENLTQLIDTVRSQQCDLGIAFDGDGDRIGVVDGEGEILWGDQLLQFYAADMLASTPGALIIADVKASQQLFDKVAELGGKPVMWKTGHSLIKSKMQETGAPLAGEMSGHIFFAENHGFDDGLFAAVMLLSILSNNSQSLAEMRQALPEAINTPEMRIPCKEEDKFRIVEELQQRLKDEGVDYSDVDGVRANTPHGWWLLRASNTQAVLVARCEAVDKAGLKALKEALAGYLKPYGINIS